MKQNVLRVFLLGLAILLPPALQWGLSYFLTRGGEYSRDDNAIMGVYMVAASFAGAGAIAYLSQNLLLVIGYFIGMMAVLWIIGMVFVGPIRGYP